MRHTLKAHKCELIYFSWAGFFSLIFILLILWTAIFTMMTKRVTPEDYSAKITTFIKYTYGYTVCLIR